MDHFWKKIHSDVDDIEFVLKCQNCGYQILFANEEWPMTNKSGILHSTTRMAVIVYYEGDLQLERILKEIPECRSAIVQSIMES